MIDLLLWPLLWSIAGFPAISARTKHALSKKACRDYAYYLEWKALSIKKLGISKLGFFAAMGVVLSIISLSFERMVSTLSIATACGVLVEYTILVGRPHPTPQYVLTELACSGCRSNTHDNCTNLRMLDGFETDFASKEGFRRPVCCCGFRIGVWRPMTV